MKLLTEFRPALMFLGKFLALYFAGNILYGLYIESFGEKPDPLTGIVTAQSAWMLDGARYHVSFEDAVGEPKIALKQGEKVVLNVYEGCNGINVIIVFIAFLFAFGGPLKMMSIFIPSGVLIIHVFNLLRIGLLFHLALNNSPHFYYYHKFFFTATLYMAVFVLWGLWVIRFSEKRNVKATA